MTGPEIATLLAFLLPLAYSPGPGNLFTPNNGLAFTVSTLAGERMARSFRDPARSRQMNIVFGLMLAAVASWMIAA